jgi:hypothetical protein
MSNGCPTEVSFLRLGLTTYLSLGFRALGVFPGMQGKKATPEALAEACDALVAACVERDSMDNLTVIAVLLEGHADRHILFDP